MGREKLKFYLDGDQEYPTICGTGTEDYFGGAWSFATQQNGRTVENTYCTPFLGYPYYSHHDSFIHNDYHNDDQMPQRSFYRWHIMDPVFFENEIKVTIQQIGVYHGGLFERQDDVATVAYWYQSSRTVLLISLWIEENAGLGKVCGARNNNYCTRKDDKKEYD